MTGYRSLAGGIASANGNVLRALTALAEESRVGLTVLSYWDAPSDRPDFLPLQTPFTAYRGRKGQFLRGVLLATVDRPLICFDHVTLALPVLPAAALDWTKTVIFAHGSEAWKRLRRTSRWSCRCARLGL